MATSSLLSRFMLAMKAGLAFQGARDFYSVFGWNRTPTVQDLLAKYERQDVAQRIVNKPPEDTWSSPPTLRLQGSEEDIKEWNTLATRLNLWSTLTQADKLCCFGKYATILLGFPGDLAKPVSRAQLTDLVYVQAYSSYAMEIKSYNKDPANPRFGLPEMYSLNLDAELSTFTSTNTPKRNTQDVHWTRIIHVVDNPLQGSLNGIPRLLPVYNTLDDVMKIVGGSAETYWLIANRGMQVDIDKDMTLDSGDAEALEDELEEFQHQLRRYIRTRGVNIKPLGSDVADPTGTFGVLLSILSGATGIPQRILLGSEAGQLASEQDRANWAEQIINRRANFAEPFILRPFIQRLQQIGALAEDSYVFVWPEAFRMSPLERAQTMAQKARAIANISRQVTNGFPIVTQEEARKIIDLVGEKTGIKNVPMLDQRPGDPRYDAAVAKEIADATKESNTGDPNASDTSSNPPAQTPDSGDATNPKDPVNL